ncbi:peptidylglycine alpha-hydroxylating monooxygenase [Atheta coriaria]|uniref:peptidylglycine alpha-hydroxylating monooxygenase n=1 Tax=Dalotia coriaria TaxID=877792 RepID=UPI0031F36184
MEAHHLCIVAVLIAAALLLREADAYDVKKFAVFMPHINPFREELYLCTPVKIVQDKSFYIVGFEPNATMNRVHHMILFGCSEPGTHEPYWDCGEMAGPTHSSNLRTGNPCRQGSHVLYAWARNAEALSLPEDVGFQIGANTEIAYLVLQLHYAHKFPEDVIDSSGVNLIYTETPQPKLAGVLLLASGGTIPAHRVTYMESDCTIEEDKIIYPFAYRTHTHTLGKVVSGYRVRQDENGEQWSLIGKRDPLTPQMFYPTNTTTPILKGDIMVARCTMESDRDTDTRVGPTNKDEMCNFYIMYYVDEGKPLNKRFCWREGPPYTSWASNHNFLNVPEDASSL